MPWQQAFSMLGAMTTFKRSILALSLSLGLAAVACSSDSDDGDGTGGNGGSGGKAGSGGGGKGGSSNTGPGAQEPDGDDGPAWKAFLEAGEYKKGGWVSDVAAPRNKMSISPHGRVRVFFNEKLAEAHGKTPSEYEKGSVVVKEFFDADNKSVGWTALRKVEDGEDEYSAWQVYCSGPADRCVQANDVSVDEPLVGGLADFSACFNCHHKVARATSTKLLYTKAP